MLKNHINSTFVPETISTGITVIIPYYQASAKAVTWRKCPIKKEIYKKLWGNFIRPIS